LKVFKDQSSQVAAMMGVLDRYRPRIKKAFIKAVIRYRGTISVSRLTALLEAGDIAGAMAMVDASGFAAALSTGEDSFSLELARAFSAGGAAAFKALPKAVQAASSFDMLNPNSVKFLNDYRVPLIREISEETAKSVQAIVLDGFETGRGYTRTAADIKKVVGLTKSQTKVVLNYRKQLETGQVLGFTYPTDRRIPASDKPAVERRMAGEPMSRQEINDLVNRYHDSMLERRALNIARTEANRASVKGQHALWNNARSEGLLPASVKRKWVITPDERLRPSHRQIPGLNPSGRGLDEDFLTLEGSVFSPPFGTNCRCSIVLGGF